MEAVVDTNVIIFDLFEDSERHGEARALLDGLSRWLIPAMVVHELVWFMRGMGLADKADYVRQYVAHEKAEVLCDCEDQVLNALAAGLGQYNDGVVLAHALARRVPLATFDRRLARRARRLGVEVLP